MLSFCPICFKPYNVCILSFRFAFDRVQPRVDNIQNIINASVSRQNGHTILDFIRPLSSGDNADDISLTSCRYFLYAFGGAVTDFAQFEIGYHGASNRFDSSQRICLEARPDQCLGELKCELTFFTLSVGSGSMKTTHLAFVLFMPYCLSPWHPQSLSTSPWSHWMTACPPTQVVSVLHHMHMVVSTAAGSYTWTDTHDWCMFECTLFCTETDSIYKKHMVYVRSVSCI